MGTPTRLSLRHRIAEHLRERVLAGEFVPGSRLPSEPNLARSLGVSRSSLRSGIAILEEDGVLRRRHGSGTYVTDKLLLSNDLSRNFSVSAMIEATGSKPGTVLGRAAAEPAPADVATAFGIATGDELSVLRRVRTADGKRVVDTTDWCRSDVLEPAALTKLADGSVYVALAQRGLTVDHGVASIYPSLASDEVARRLRVPVDTLLLTLFQVDSTADEEVVLVSLEHHLADAFDISIYRRGGADAGEDQPRG